MPGNGNQTSTRERQRIAAILSKKYAAAPFGTLPSTFSHIQTKAVAEASSDDLYEHTFVTRQSLEAELRHQFFQNTSFASEARISHPHVATFAETAKSAAVMTRSKTRGSRRGRGRNRSSKGGGDEEDEDDELPHTRRMALSSIAPFRFSTKIHKKKSKWSPLEVADADEASSDAARNSPSRATSPSGDNRIVAEDNDAEGDGQPSRSSGTVPKEQQSSRTSIVSSEDQTLFDETPTQAVFNAAFPRLGGSPPAGSARAHQKHIIDSEDSESTRDKLENIMARIDDAFDVEEWDPDVTIDETNNSPERLTVKPEPVTYTTVGSLVKSNATPTFTAPVRIQREGAGRRLLFQPPISSNLSRGKEQAFAPRNQNQLQTSRPVLPLSAQPSPFSGAQFGFQSKFGRPTPDLNDLEREQILRSLGVSSPRSAPRAQNNAGSLSRNPFQSYKPRPEAYSSSSTSANSSYPGESSSQTPFIAPSLRLDSFQMLNRLSQYSNPAQKYAKDVLSEYAASEAPSVDDASQLASNATGDTGHSPGHQKFQSGKDIILQEEADSSGDLQKYLGECGLQSEVSNGSKLMRGFSAFAGTSNVPEQSMPQFNNGPYHQTPSVPPGLPQPLTAGPPGNRTSDSSLKASLNASRSVPVNGQPQAQRNIPPPSIWTNIEPNPYAQKAQHDKFRSETLAGPKIRDTLPKEAIQKYYPNGFLPGHTGQYQPLDQAVQDLYLNGNIQMTDDECRAANRANQLADWWNSGLRRHDMTGDDHIRDLERRQTERLRGLVPTRRGGVLARPFSPAAERTTYSVEQIQAAAKPECTALLLDGAFGTLLGYAEKGAVNESRNVASAFSEAPAECVDGSETGNNSFFSSLHHDNNYHQHQHHHHHYGGGDGQYDEDDDDNDGRCNYYSSTAVAGPSVGRCSPPEIGSESASVDSPGATAAAAAAAERRWQLDDAFYVDRRQPKFAGVGHLHWEAGMEK